MAKLLSVFILLFCSTAAFAQDTPLILHANSDAISIRDGSVLRSNYWTVSPTIPLDIYEADKTSSTKTVTYISDIDSIQFEISPGSTYDFVIIIQHKDSCFNRVRSGIDPSYKKHAHLPSDTISFVLTATNNLIIPAVINNTDTLQLMFHSAAHGVTLTRAAAIKATSVAYNTSDTAAAWGGGGVMRFSKDNTVSIGASSWDAQQIKEDLNSGAGSDGKFGPSFFRNKIIEINFDASLFIIHHRLPDTQHYTQFPLIFDQSDMLLQGNLKFHDISYTNRYLIHTGYSGTVLLDYKFSSSHSLEAKLKAKSTRQLKDSFGNDVAMIRTDLPLMTIGKFKFKNVPAGFFNGEIGRQSKSVIGTDLLKRFNIILDLQTAAIYLQANSLINTDFTEL